MELKTHTLSTGWSFRDSETEDWMPVSTVPSVVQQDLLDNNKLEDPFAELNEVKARWVNQKSWVYRNTFDNPTFSNGSAIDLVFDGLDTFATVKLDGQVILQSDNMFLGRRVNVTKAMQAEGEHTLEIEFKCAEIKARELRDQDKSHKWVGFNGDMSRLAVRKAQYHWGWDWGPVLMTAGIWRPVRLEAYTARVADLWPQTSLSLDQETAKVTTTIKVETTGVKEYRARFTLSVHGKEFARQDIPLSANQAQVSFPVNRPELWWPHGYGNQTLYEVSVLLLCGEQIVDQKSKRFGIRSAEVIQQPDKHGKSFFFRINGMDIFCGGSCWIPADSLLTNVTPDRYRKWIEMMVEGQQVMIRVWGGGIYEDATFYEACDELGVMVWQDFMFGCGNYPTWPSLLESVRQEAIYNLTRLRHHPSIVIYVGNNEDYQVQESVGLTYDFEDKNPENWLKSDFPARYIYEKLLPDVALEYSPGTFYHPGSPWGDGKISSDPTVGDMHQWNVWHGTQEKYQIFDTLGGRFNSEFGMEAFPHMETIKSFSRNPKDHHPQSQVMDFHNKADGHERRLATYLVENFRFPHGGSLEAYIYQTQAVQAETMMFGYRGWRRQWGDERHCGGALLWQLNDCWPTISWAIVDYFLRPKPAYYAVKRVLNPIAVGVRREHHDWSVVHAQPALSSQYELWVVSNKPETLQGKVELRFISIETGKEIRSPLIRNILIVGNGTTNVITDGIIDHVAEPDPHVLAARVWVNNELVARDVDWPQPFKYINIPTPPIEIKRSSSSRTDNVQTVTIAAQKPVKCLVFEERDGIRYSDNALDIVPGDVQQIAITGLSADVSSLTYRFLGREESAQEVSI
ncbi:Glycoside hydrolase family 2 immunoglobulin-like beta-sandwich [Penicillium odoratum]|uniref:Glycoside hydrolase family 2 immunoglobulin-like beta-sandwich n=1 Tax=Penicillium odoratum TaxID=1167516 RepID=UPI0025494949|nr:Glycoside hydrolase family 2 immunoglobulin-like beta-sandwich [Penicillium odoratum]KAJ5778752.1 Glycoside hydrolase family 2 immunoglobulin-like beta-sandwich [Penicillium odoratum]